MARRGSLSIRARLTLFFVIAVGGVLLFTGVALVSLVHRSLISTATNQIDAVMTETQSRLAVTPLGRGEMRLPTQSNVVVQVTNYAGTQVWAASTAIEDYPVLAHASPDIRSPDGLRVAPIRTAATAAALPQVSQGVVQPITTSRGVGWIYSYVYGTSISHSVGVLVASVATSFPLLLLIAGVLIWYGIGLTLAPVEAIRRRVNVIAARDLSERVPVTGGDDEIARMARTVNAMLDRLEAASRFQQEFVSNASHELRSPLTTLLATVERAQGDPEHVDWPEVAETVRREGRRLDGLIDDLFWLARHDENEIEALSVDVDLDDLLFEEARRVRSLTELSVDTSAVQPTRVVGDPAMLKRLVRNVVDNASRYASRELRFASGYDEDMAVVRVADDGEGLDVASSAGLFERFRRADSARSRRSGGTGLGLAIVKEIVTRHGGSARFVEVERGATIELRVRRDGQRA